MTRTSQQSQTVPLQVHQADNRLVLAAPMPGLEAQDIAVIINGNRVTIQGEYRGSRQNQPEILISEWTIGPYYREVVLPRAARWPYRFRHTANYPRAACPAGGADHPVSARRSAVLPLLLGPLFWVVTYTRHTA
jgi:hypothetical protein